MCAGECEGACANRLIEGSVQVSLAYMERTCQARYANPVDVSAFDSTHCTANEIAVNIPLGGTGAGIGLAPLARSQASTLGCGCGWKEPYVLAERSNRGRAAGSTVNARRGDAGNELAIETAIAAEQCFVATIIVVAERGCRGHLISLPDPSAHY